MYSSVVVEQWNLCTNLLVVELCPSYQVVEQCTGLLVMGQPKNVYNSEVVKEYTYVTSYAGSVGVYSCVQFWCD